jgi:hypothetical protein
MTPFSIPGWIPVSVDVAELTLSWLEMTADDLVDPMFQQTMSRVRRRAPPAREGRSDFNFLFDYAGPRPSIVPSGIIFHLSRCGSTVLSNSLRHAPNAIVLSECPLISDLCLATLLHPHRTELLTNLIASAVSVIASSSARRDARLVIKCASVDLLSIHVLRRIWPSVKAALIIRDPREISVSQIRKPSNWMKWRSSVPLESRFIEWNNDNSLLRMDQEEYCARVLAGLCECAESLLREEGCIVVDYESLCPRKLSEIAAFFGLAVTPADLETDVLLYSKDPLRRRRFVEDREDKLREVTPSMRAALDRYVTHRYLRLKTLAV